MTAELMVFPGVVEAELVCVRCGHRWRERRGSGATGVRCPRCALEEPRFRWVVPGWRPELGHDGAWLTGIIFLPILRAQSGAPVAPAVVPVVPAEPAAVQAGWRARLRGWWAGLWLRRPSPPTPLP